MTNFRKTVPTDKNKNEYLDFLDTLRSDITICCKMET